MLDSPQHSMLSSTTFCPLPFMHTYITADGSLSPCCEAQETKLADTGAPFAAGWNSEPYQELRRALLNSEKPVACSKCWRNEENGILSNRQQASLDLSSDFYGENTLVPDELVCDVPVSIELKCNNLCNLKCRMCHPESSHRINEDRDIIAKYRKGLPWSDKPLSSKQTVDQILSMSDEQLSRLRHVQFSGGEPLISREQYDLVKKLLSHKPENIHLRYATNLSILKFEDFDYLDIWSRFKKVNVKVSADGIFDVYNYIRVGAQFENLVDNLKRLIEKKPDNVSVNIGFTTQAYNVFQLPEFFTFFKELVGEHHVHQYLLHTPWFMQINVFPPEYRKALIAKLAPHSEFSQLIKVIDSGAQYPKGWNTLLQYTSEMELKYNISTSFTSLLEKYLGSSRNI